MKPIFNAIKIIIILAILYSCGTAVIDYYRMKNGDVPIFNKSEYDSRNKIQRYKGIIYNAERKIKTSTNEPLSESSNIKFKVLTKEFNIPSTWKEEKKEFTLDIQKIANCSTSTLYYADDNNKIYTYCLEEIQVVKDKQKESLTDALKNDDKLLQNIFNNLGYLGKLSDGTLQYQNRNDGFTSSDITVYQCDNELVKDIYITPKDVLFQPDFCTVKNDSILEEQPETP